MNAVIANGILSVAGGIIPHQGDKHHFVAIADYAKIYLINSYPENTGFSRSK